MKKQSERRKSAESIQNEEGSSSNLNLTKVEAVGSQHLALNSQSALNDQDSVINQLGQVTLKGGVSGQVGSQGNLQQLGKTKSKSMIHSGSNLQGNINYNTSSNNHLFLTSQGNNNNTNSNSNLNYNSGYRHIEQFPKIQEAYSQLNSMVEFLEDKVDGVIERHEAEFLLAYKNHMVKIRKELQEMKNRMDEQDKKLKAGDKMDQLEKQLSWFRDESLKLYEKLGQKDKQITDFKHIVADQKKDIAFQEQQITSLKKKIRQLVKKVSGNTENFNFDERSQSSSAQNYYMSQGGNAQLDNISQNYSSNAPHSNPQNMQSNFHQGRGKVSSSNSIGNRRPQSSEYSTHQSKLQQNMQNQVSSNSNNNINNLSNNNIYLSSLNRNISNNQYSLLGDVVEQNETQNSQGNNDDNTINQGYSMNNTRQKFGVDNSKVDWWIPQSDFIAEMCLKYQHEQITLVKEITHMFKIEEEKKQKQIKQMKDRLDKVLKEKLTQNVLRSDLENFFLECIETVRKQIIKRKPPLKNGDNQLNFYLNQIKDYSIFRNEDKIKILELLLSNERLLMFIYQKIFPQNFNKFMNYAVNQTQTPNANEQEPEGGQDKSKLNQNQKLSGKNIDTEALVRMVQEIQDQHRDSEDGTTPINKLSIQQQIERVQRPKTREVDSSILQANKFANRNRPFTQQNQANSHNLTFDEYNVNTSFQNQKKRQSNNSFSVENNQASNNILTAQPNSIKQKLSSLINNDFSSISSQKRASFKSKITQYKIY